MGILVCRTPGKKPEEASSAREPARHTPCLRVTCDRNAEDEMERDGEECRGREDFKRRATARMFWDCASVPHA